MIVLGVTRIYGGYGAGISLSRDFSVACPSCLLLVLRGAAVVPWFSNNYGSGGHQVCPCLGKSWQVYGRRATHNAQ